MISATVTSRDYDNIDLSSRGFRTTTAADHETSFAYLREHRPLSWHKPVEDGLLQEPSDPGFWAVVRHADIIDVSRRNDVFISDRLNYIPSLTRWPPSGAGMLPTTS
jgi:hypothetical protein